MSRQAVLGTILFVILAGATVLGVLLLRGDGDDAVVALDPTTTTTEQLETPRPPSTTQTPQETTTSEAVSTSSYEPVFEASSCDFDLFTDLDFRCGYLVVPENRDNPDNGRAVRLHVSIFQTENTVDPADPIVYLDGGPGGESLAPLQFSLIPTWSDFIANRDMIFFDQRGTGLSQPSLKCPETRELTFELIDDDLPPEDYVAEELDALAQCKQRLIDEGIDLSQYNSATNAADVADLRTALGYDEWNLFGISYGTRLAQTVMRDHPEGLRSVILDSTYTPDVDLIASAPDNFDRALDVFFGACEADDDCATTYPDLENRLFSLIDDLDATPVTATVTDFLEDNDYEAVIDGQFLLGTVFSGLYSEAVIPLLPQVITEMEERDTSTIELLASNDLAQGAFFSYGMHISVQCTEELPFVDPNEVADAGARYERLSDFFFGASNIGLPMFDICELWDVPSGGSFENDPVTSAIPTLVLAGVHDPITPPSWGKLAATTLTNGRYIEFPGLGHGASVSGDCPLAITLAFIDDPLAVPDTSCIVDMGGPDWVIPGRPAEAIVLTAFAESVFGVEVSGVVPESWEAAGPGSWSRGETFVDQTSIVQQAVPGTLDPQLFASGISGQIGFDEDPVDAGTLEAGNRTWTLFTGSISGFPVDMAIGDDGSTTGIILLISEADDRNQLYDDVFAPALEAFRTP